MNLVFLIDESKDYGRHLGVTLISVLENTKKKWDIKIIYKNISEKSKNKIEEICQKYNSNLEWIHLEESLLKNFKVGKGTHLKEIVFGRLYIPQLLLNEKRAIYLDCDIIVKKPLEKLYNMDLEGKSIGVILDGEKDQKSSVKRLNLSSERTYFNAGVMIMDLEKLRKNNKFLKTIEFCLNPDRELQLNEQDALNIIFENDYSVKEKIWNCTHGVLEEYRGKIEDIGIIHYTGAVKPWDCRCLSPLKKEYLNYLKISPWKGWKEENKNLKNCLITFFTKLKLQTRKYRYIFKGEKGKK